MFDSELTNTQKFTFNSVSGTIAKSDKSSIITKCHIKSPLADCMLDSTNPRIKREHYKDIYIDVLQVMLCGENQLLIEYRIKVPSNG
jgi:hypothetical protein